MYIILIMDLITWRHEEISSDHVNTDTALFSIFLILFSTSWCYLENVCKTSHDIFFIFYLYDFFYFLSLLFFMVLIRECVQNIS